MITIPRFSFNMLEIYVLIPASYVLQSKLQEHLQNVTGFHTVMKVFTEWLINGETSLSKLKTPSKLVPPIEQQIKQHKVCSTRLTCPTSLSHLQCCDPCLCMFSQVFHDDVEQHKEIVDRLDRTGTYLKYYGAKHDAIVIRNQLLSIKLRWKRLLWKTEERGRLLNSAYREDKRVSISQLLYWFIYATEYQR